MSNPTLFTDFPEISATASLSDCGTYRYTLGRRWDETKQPLGFIMLNPSTADAFQDDPTIRRCIGFAKENGYGGIEVRNLFAFRATSPSVLPTVEDPVGPDNDVAINGMADMCEDVACAWGIDGALMNRDEAVMGILHSLPVRILCLCVTKDGHPGHPLYLPAKSPLVPFAFVGRTR